MEEKKELLFLLLVNLTIKHPSKSYFWEQVDFCIKQKKVIGLRLNLGGTY
jgi:hypothetical protein